MVAKGGEAIHRGDGKRSRVQRRKYRADWCRRQVPAEENFFPSVNYLTLLDRLLNYCCLRVSFGECRLTRTVWVLHDEVKTTSLMRGEAGTHRIHGQESLARARLDGRHPIL
jgi:hypothetical protein